MRAAMFGADLASITPPPAVPIYIVDDDAAFRGELAELLSARFGPVQQFASGEALLARARTLPPGVILLDQRMTGLQGLETLAMLERHFPTHETILQSGFADVPLAVSAMRMGAIDVLPKPATLPRLIATVAEAATRIVRRLEANHWLARDKELLGLLNRREREVLDGICAGLSNKQMGLQLGISYRTVEVHRARMMRKLRLDSLSDVWNFAGRLGLVAGDRVGTPS